MANRHYGKIGDIWKHLPLAEILTIEKPYQYWETHAGSAQYPLTHSWERDYGVFYFLEHAAESLLLKSSAFFHLLDGFKQEDGQLPIYPASPLIAMTLLRPNAKNYLFCDIDGGSLDTIWDSASTIGIPDADVKCVQDDGVATVLKAASKLSTNEVAGTFIHIDPYEPFQESKTGLAPIDLFCQASQQGAKAMLWYGYDSLDYQRFCWESIKSSFAANKLDTSIPLWRGEITLSAINNPDFKMNPGVLGCGILCSNLSERAMLACSELGEDLAKIYRNASFPNGHSGAIEFATVPL